MPTWPSGVATSSSRQKVGLDTNISKKKKSSNFFFWKFPSKFLNFSKICSKFLENFLNFSEISIFSNVLRTGFAFCQENMVKLHLDVFLKNC